MSRERLLFAALIVATTILYYGLQILSIEQVKLQPRLEPAVPGANGRNKTRTTSIAPPLRTAGRYIVDANGQRIKLAAVNWYGASDIHFVPMGLDKRHRSAIAETIREMGFNSVRFPYSDQMVLENPIVDPAHLGANLDLFDRVEATSATVQEPIGTDPGVRALDVFKACVDAMTDAGLAVIINDHITNAHWCDGKNLCDASWKNDHYGSICSVRQTTASWIANWEKIMVPHIGNSLVIGADLRNEPRGLWGTMTWNMWATAAEQASEALLKLQPDWLMFVEGISSANDCSGARNRPIKLSVPNRVVYSSHVYSWSGWSTLVPYGRRAYASFARDMERNWGFLLRNNIAPVWVGEFGIMHHGDSSAINYWNNLMRYLQETDADWGYWALNPRKPAEYDEETYGLLADDWKTTIEDWRLRDLRILMDAQEVL